MSTARHWDFTIGRTNIMLTALVLLLFPQAGHCQVEYTVKGKPVSKQVYQAIVLVNESLPLINSGRLPEAVDKLTQALKLEPNLPEANYNLGLALLKQGKPEEALPHLKTVVDSGVDLPTAWISLAGLYQNSGKFDQAVAVYKDAFKKFPSKTWDTLPEIHYNYGLALGKIGQSDQAVEQLKMALPAKTGLPGLWLSMGAIYQASGRIQESIDSYKEFLNRFPQNEEVSRVRGAVKLMEKEFKQSEKEKKAAAAAGPSSSDDYYVEITMNGVKKWSPEQMPIRVYLQPGNSMHGYKTDYDEIFKQCFQEWIAASNGKISIQYVTDPSRAALHCSWGDDPGKLANRAEGGEAKIYVRQDGTIARGTIIILTVPITPLRPITDNLIRFVSLHEIGHALGIAGHSTKPGDVMFFSSTLTDDRKELSSRDVKTVRRLYSAD